MRFFIQVRNDGPFEHPISEQNLKHVYPDFDPDNPPHGLVEFIREKEPKIGIWEVLSGSFYEKTKDGKYTDAYYVRQMTHSEKLEKIRLTRERFPFKSWILDEKTLKFAPPVPKPEDGNFYDWSEIKRQWLPLDEKSISVPHPEET